MRKINPKIITLIVMLFTLLIGGALAVDNVISPPDELPGTGEPTLGGG